MTYQKGGYTYILANKKNGTFYTGVTSDLPRRIHEHKNNLIEGFTKKYNIHVRVYYEHAEDIRTAIERENQIKNWKREWKIDLIQEENPEWKDLSDEIMDSESSSE